MPIYVGRMKRMRGFIWLLTAMFAVFLTVLLNWQEQEVVPTPVSLAIIFGVLLLSMLSSVLLTSSKGKQS